MSKVRIITDSASDLPIEIVEKYGIKVIGLDVIFGEDRFEEGVGMDNDTFYKRMKQESQLPKTACPSPDKFLDLYKEENTDVVVISISSKLSGTYNSAVLAKSMYDEDGGVDIRVIDTLSGSIGEGLLVYYAAKLSEDGKSADEIEKAIMKLIDKEAFFGVLQTLENAIKGGRISKLAGSIINTFNFKALIKVEGGLVHPFDKARGEGNSVRKLISLFLDKQENTENKTLFIGHSNLPEKAEKVKIEIEKLKAFKEVVICEIGPIMGTYAAEGCILLNAAEI